MLWLQQLYTDNTNDNTNDDDNANDDNNDTWQTNMHRDIGMKAKWAKKLKGTKKTRKMDI